MPLPKKKTEKSLDPLLFNYLWYGKPKSGKSTTASELADAAETGSEALFFATEPGHKLLEIFKWEKEDPRNPNKTVGPENWNDFLSCCKELYEEDHNYRLLVVDTADILWEWCTDHVCMLNDISHPSELGFGKGYQAIAAEFKRACNKLGQRGIGFVFVSHEKEYEITVGPRKETAVTTTLATGARKFIEGFVDFIWYFSSSLDGERYIRTKRGDNINAGSRGDKKLPPLPEIMEMDSKEIIKEMKKL